MIKLAVMQGRLLPSEDGRIQCSPKLHWREEFPLAEELGLYGIEWIDDLYSADTNALHTDEGIAEIKALMQKHHVVVPSICANIFMEQEREKRVAHLQFLLQQAKKVGAKHVLLPFFGDAELKTDEDMKDVIHIIDVVLPLLEELDLAIHLETTLEPASFKALLDRIPHSRIKVTYDTGNSAGLGYDPKKEFAAYGDRIGSVHIKDKKKGGSSIPLGEGDVDFELIRSLLSSISFDGLYTLEAARGKPGEELNRAKSYVDFARGAF